MIIDTGHPWKIDPWRSIRILRYCWETWETEADVFVGTCWLGFIGLVYFERIKNCGLIDEQKV